MFVTQKYLPEISKSLAVSSNRLIKQQRIRSLPLAFQKKPFSCCVFVFLFLTGQSRKCMQGQEVLRGWNTPRVITERSGGMLSLFSHQHARGRHSRWDAVATSGMRVNNVASDVRWKKWKELLCYPTSCETFFYFQEQRRRRIIFLSNTWVKGDTIRTISSTLEWKVWGIKADTYSRTSLYCLL